MSKPFNVYQALNAACKKYKFAGDDKAELWRRVLEDKPHDRADSKGKYRAVMGYAKQLRKELDDRDRGREILHNTEFPDLDRSADDVRKERVKHGLMSTSRKVASIMD
jgi:hypothetical protein